MMRLVTIITLSCLALAACSQEPRPEAPRVNLLLITVDSLRADRLGCYGYHRPTSPAIDRLAAESVRFDNAISPSSWTLPSVMSIMTGLFPSTHGLEHFSSTLPEETPTLGTLMRDAGYRTYAAISHAVIDPSQFGTARGFDTVHYYKLSHWEISSPRYTGDALAWLSEDGGDRPWFAWLHYYDPHYNFVPHEDSKELYSFNANEFDPKNYDIIDVRKRGPYALMEREYAYLSDLYDGEIAYTDRHIGRLLDSLREQRLLENTLVILTADHGESLGEHGEVDHTHIIYDNVARVPLIVRIPFALQVPGHLAARGSVSHSPVVTVDVLPTVLDWLGVPRPPIVEGLNLLEIPEWDPRLRVTETNKIGEDAVSFVAVRRDTQKAVFNRISREFSLFNLAADPGELENQYTPGSTLARDLFCDGVKWARRAAVRVVPKKSATVDPALRERLKAIGYIGTGSSSVPEGELWELLKQSGVDCE